MNNDNDEPVTTSRLEQPGLSIPSPTLLTGRKKVVYDLLIERLDIVDAADLTAVGKVKQKARIAALIGLLCAMDEETFEAMNIKSVSQFAVMVGGPAQDLLDLCKYLLLLFILVQSQLTL